MPKTSEDVTFEAGTWRAVATTRDEHQNVALSRCPKLGLGYEKPFASASLDRMRELQDVLDEAIRYLEAHEATEGAGDE